MRIAILGKFFIAIWFAALLATGCGQTPSRMASDCERRVETRVDPVALQAWATNLLDQYSITKTNYGGPFPLYPPLKKIWDQAPPTVGILGGDTQGGEFVCVIWGSAAGHWGLSIGKPSFVPSIPQRAGRMWKTGIYFWRDFH
jgi:hypothetical protein